MEIKIKCPDCRTGYYHYCSTDPPIYVCSNYGGGCSKAISEEEYEKLAKQIMPKMSLYEIRKIIFDIAHSKQIGINEFKKESGNDKIDISAAIGWLHDFARQIVEDIE